MVHLLVEFNYSLYNLPVGHMIEKNDKLKYGTGSLVSQHNHNGKTIETFTYDTYGNQTKEGHHHMAAARRERTWTGAARAEGLHCHHLHL